MHFVIASFQVPVHEHMGGGVAVSKTIAGGDDVPALAQVYPKVAERLVKGATVDN